MGAGFTRSAGDRLTGVPCLSLVQCLTDYKVSGWSVPRSRALLVPPASACFTSDLAMPIGFLHRNPFYQDFMRPHGLARRAALRLALRGQDLYRFVFYRTETEGPFLQEETRILDCIAPHLLAAATICQSAFDKQICDQNSRFARHGVAALALGADGRLVENAPFAGVHIPLPLSATHGRVTLPFPSEQDQLDRAIAKALAAEGAPTLLRLCGTEKCLAPLLVVIPVTGEAKEVFASVAAFVVVADAAQKTTVSLQSLEVLGRSLSLTPRELSVVGIVASGQDLKSAARRFDISVSTARNHLKSAMHKAGVHSQVELAAFVARFSGLVVA
jgi:DNA-binding CsgD family transcriptional regulator